MTKKRKGDRPGTPKQKSEKDTFGKKGDGGD